MVLFISDLFAGIGDAGHAFHIAVIEIIQFTYAQGFIEDFIQDFVDVFIMQIEDGSCDLGLAAEHGNGNACIWCRL